MAFSVFGLRLKNKNHYGSIKLTSHPSTTFVNPGFGGLIRMYNLYVPVQKRSFQKNNDLNVVKVGENLKGSGKRHW